MDGIYFIVLLLFGALTGALLILCAALGARTPPGGDRQGGGDSGAPSGKHSAQDRGQ